MVGANLSPAYDLGKRLSKMDKQIAALNTKITPVVPSVIYHYVTDFSIPSTTSTIVSASVSVPTGYTRAIVQATAALSAFCLPAGGGQSDYIYASVLITAGSQVAGSSQLVTLGQTSSTSVNAGNINPVLSPAWANDFHNLSVGESITVALQANTGEGWNAATSNIGTVCASIFFLPA